jgi:hypothetical protein
MIERVGKALSPIVDTPHLKFQHTKGAVIMHFGSEVIQEELHDFLIGVFYGMVETFILTEMTDNVSLCMSDETKAHLLDLDNDGDDIQIKIDMSDMKKNEFDEELTEDFINFLLDEFNEEVKVPTLNEILDKINEKGIKSLSTFEKEILDNYSKK